MTQETRLLLTQEAHLQKMQADGSDSFNTIEDYSDLDWPEMTWNFACSTTETSTWADGGT